MGIDRKKGNKLMSFQELSSRERGNKHSSISIENIKVSMRFTKHHYHFGLPSVVMGCTFMCLMPVSFRTLRNYCSCSLISLIVSL